MENSWKLHHVGVIVRDLDKAVEAFQLLGVGTIPPEWKVDNRIFPDLKAYGKPVDASFYLRERDFSIGSLEVHLLQQGEGESTQKDFLDERGEGIEHIAFAVDDFDKEVAKLVEKGFPVDLGGSGPDVKWAHFDTRKVCNVVIELVWMRK